MKVKVVSQSGQRAEEIAQLLRTGVSELDVHAVASTLGGLPTLMNGVRPGLLVVDGVDAPGLDAIGQLTHAFPDVETIVISTEQTPAFLLRAMQVGVREVLPQPVNAPLLQAAVQRIARKRLPADAAKQGEVIAFMSCKGGSGATFLAANLAHVLSERDERTVALLDFDLQFGDCLLMVSDQRAASDIAEVARNIERLDADLLRRAMMQASPSLAVLAAPEELSHALEVKAQQIEAIVKQARQMYDFVVIDAGHAIDAVSLQALDMAARIFPVVQLSLPQMREAKRLRALFRSLDYAPSKIQWLVNRYQKGHEITLASLEQTLGTKGLTTIPNHYAGVSASVNQGVPIGRMARNNPVSRAIAELADHIAPAASPGKKERWLSSLFGN